MILYLFPKDTNDDFWEIRKISCYLNEFVSRYGNLKIKDIMENYDLFCFAELLKNKQIKSKLRRNPLFYNSLKLITKIPEFPLLEME
ncbi:MAG: hypothetical protein FWC11_01490 [Firmicutes bacterium]|nr:hypothetical protein [Bacillota bacterium]